MTTLISVISEQTIPNLLLIRELKGKYKDQVFITTPDMERQRRSQWIETAAGIPENSVRRIIVDENSLPDIRQKLTAAFSGDVAGFHINLTGGTKPMTIGIYEFFSKPGNRIVYVPIGKNHQEELYPNPGCEDIPIAYRLNLMEYLLAYGLYYQSDEALLHPKEFTAAFFNDFRRKKFRFNIEPRIINAQQNDSEIEKVYYSGRWFEEFVFTSVAESLQLESGHIALSVKIFRDPDSPQHDNEFDVMFVLDNALYVIECKARVGNYHYIKDNMDDYMNKLAAITRDFGLRVNSFIFTLTDIENIAGNKYPNIEKRRRILGIKGIVDAKDFLNGDIEIVNYFSNEAKHNS